MEWEWVAAVECEAAEVEWGVWAEWGAWGAEGWVEWGGWEQEGWDLEDAVEEEWAWGEWGEFVHLPLFLFTFWRLGFTIIIVWTKMSQPFCMWKTQTAEFTMLEPQVGLFF